MAVVEKEASNGIATVRLDAANKIYDARAAQEAELREVQNALDAQLRNTDDRVDAAESRAITAKALTVEAKARGDRLQATLNEALIVATELEVSVLRGQLHIATSVLHTLLQQCRQVWQAASLGWFTPMARASSRPNWPPWQIGWRSWATPSRKLSWRAPRN